MDGQRGRRAGPRDRRRDPRAPDHRREHGRTRPATSTSRPPCACATRAATEGRTMHRYRSQTGAALILLIGIIVALAASCRDAGLRHPEPAERDRERASSRSSPSTPPRPPSTPRSRWPRSTRPCRPRRSGSRRTSSAIAFAGAFPPAPRWTSRCTTTSRPWTTTSSGTRRPTAATRPTTECGSRPRSTYQGKTTRTRVLIEQTMMPFAEALPKAVTYSDTGITLDDTSDIYAVDARRHARSRPRASATRPHHGRRHLDPGHVLQLEPKSADSRRTRPPTSGPRAPRTSRSASRSTVRSRSAVRSTTTPPL